MLPRKPVWDDHISFHVMWDASLPRQGSFFTKNSSKAIHPPPTRTITVLRRIRTSRNCWESPNWNQGEIQLTGAPQCRFIFPPHSQSRLYSDRNDVAVGEEFRTQFCIFTLSEKGQRTENQKDYLWATVMISFHWDKISFWWLHPGSCTTGKGDKKDIHLLTWILLKVLPKGAPHTVIFISLKNGDQLLNTVCWKVKWMAANTKSSIKKTLAKHPHYKLRKKFGFCSSGSQK